MILLLSICICSKYAKKLRTIENKYDTTIIYLHFKYCRKIVQKNLGDTGTQTQHLVLVRGGIVPVGYERISSICCQPSNLYILLNLTSRPIRNQRTLHRLPPLAKQGGARHRPYAAGPSPLPAFASSRQRRFPPSPLPANASSRLRLFPPSPLGLYKSHGHHGQTRATSL